MNTIHQRHSIRLKGYDYSQPGGYFITLVTHEREYLFGNIEGGEMKLNEFGEIVEREWLRTPLLRAEIELGEFVIMPNHFHAIVLITESNVGAYGHTPLHDDTHQPSIAPKSVPSSMGCANPDQAIELFQSPSKTTGALLRGFKGVVTKIINGKRNSPRVPVWQRNYYEHIIRSEREHGQIADYILSNPANWESDDENIKK